MHMSAHSDVIKMTLEISSDQSVEESQGLEVELLWFSCLQCSNSVESWIQNYFSYGTNTLADVYKTNLWALAFDLSFFWTGISFNHTFALDCSPVLNFYILCHVFYLLHFLFVLKNFSVNPLCIGKPKKIQLCRWYLNICIHVDKIKGH